MQDVLHDIDNENVKTAYINKCRTKCRVSFDNLNDIVFYETRLETIWPAMHVSVSNIWF